MLVTFMQAKIVSQCCKVKKKCDYSILTEKFPAIEKLFVITVRLFPTIYI